VLGTRCRDMDRAHGTRNQSDRSATSAPQRPRPSWISIVAPATRRVALTVCTPVAGS
jgi:hypothetical protein